MATTTTTEHTCGWVITTDRINADDDFNRVGYGQGAKEAKETVASFERVIGRTIFMRDDLTVNQIPIEQRVRFKAFDDDMELYYEGVVDLDWLMGTGRFEEIAREEFCGDLGYEIDRFCMEDAGAVHVYYSGKDIAQHAQYKEMVERHPKGSGKLSDWLPIYS